MVGIRSWVGHRFRAGERGRSRGQAIVELALITPIMLLLLIGALDVGRLFYFDIIVGNAVREGARRAIDHNYTNAQIQAIVQAAAPEVTVTGITINPSTRNSSTPENTSVTVVATYSVNIFTPGISSLIGSPKQVTQHATMKML